MNPREAPNDPFARATARPLRVDAQRNREQILAAAQIEFAASGSEAQIDAIALRAGVGVGTVYRHFPTKEVLVTKLMRARFEEFVDAAWIALEIEDPWDAFRSFMCANAKLCADDAGTQHVFMQSSHELPGRMAAETGLSELTQRLIDRGQASGVIRADFTAHDIGMIMCGVASAIHFGDPAWDWRRHLGFVLDGLRTHAPTN